MKVRALRGVCIGVNKHLKVNDTAELDPATVQFLVGTGAVEEVKAKANPLPAEPASESAPAKTGK